MRGKGNTKERILEESMKLFSVSGYDVVSIRTIADAVGIGNSALYKHFKGKQEIFDTLVEVSKERYLKQCKEAATIEIRGVEQVKEVCLSMYRYQTSNEWIVMFRRMLTIEQFKNPHMAEIYKEFFIDIPIKSQQEIFKELIKQGLMKDKNPTVMAMELYAPFYMYHLVKDDEQDLIRRFELHTEYFFDNYIRKEKDTNDSK